MHFDSGVPKSNPSFSKILIYISSTRSTKSEKLYSSSMGGRDGYHASQPTSPTPPGGTRLPISPLNTVRGSPYYSTVIPRTSKDDECKFFYYYSGSWIFYN